MDAKILELFKEHTGEYLSGEEISDRLRVTRAAVWKHIEKLRDIGYDIEAVPHIGYRLRAVPDKMIPEEIQYKLDTTFMGKRVVAFAKTDSTNTVAYTLAREGAEEGVVVVAEQQQRGRGRLGRRWVSPPGGVYVSCIMRPLLSPSSIQEFTLVAALSVVDTLRDVTGITAAIKWPNDIMIGEKKVSGILTEMKAETDRIDFVILGIGVNVNCTGRMLPETATSLKEHLKKRVKRVAIIQTLLRNLEREYLMFRAKGFESVRDRVVSCSYTLGRRVRISRVFTKRKSGGAVDASLQYEGQAIGIDRGGALIVRLQNGHEERVLSGDVTIVT